jgi:hypothetical protein
VRINAAGTIDLNGPVRVNGVTGLSSAGQGSGGGSGGGIDLRCNLFKGSGSLEANGGNGGWQIATPTVSGGGGGGGRIAVWYIHNTFTGIASVSNGTSVITGRCGSPGTLMFIPPGTIISIR